LFDSLKRKTKDSFGKDFSIKFKKEVHQQRHPVFPRGKPGVFLFLVDAKSILRRFSLGLLRSNLHRHFVNTRVGS